MTYFITALLILIFLVIFYDRFIQRNHQLLINYPLIGRFRYLFEALREPFRQYFADEEFYKSKDKVDWVYDVSHNKHGFISFSPNQPQQNPKFIINNALFSLNDEEVSDDFSVVFGENRKYPFTSQSIIARSAMSDGAISPEGTRAFSRASYNGKFAINTGEGGLTSNFFFTHKCDVEKEKEFLQIVKLKGFSLIFYKFIKSIFHSYTAISIMRKYCLLKDEEDTFIFDEKSLVFFRINWDANVKHFPKKPLDDMPDIIFQMSSALNGVRDENGNFDENKYKKIMSFCKMTEIKLAQGAKQTGGKLIASKVTPAIAYYRGVQPYKDLFAPNKFPYAQTVEELFDFVARLQELSQKPVGFKIVISTKKNFLIYANEIKKRITQKLPGVPDFITIDGGDGGSATAPLFLMDRVGLHATDAVHIADTVLKDMSIRDKVKLVASSRLLAPDDIAVVMCLGADSVQIARGFMLSAGCLRTRMCSGEGSHQCPVGLATQDKGKRKSYLVTKQSAKIVNYHNSLLKGIKSIMSVVGVNHHSKLDSTMVSFVDRDGFIHEDVNRYKSL